MNARDLFEFTEGLPPRAKVAVGLTADEKLVEANGKNGEQIIIAHAGQRLTMKQAIRFGLLEGVPTADEPMHKKTKALRSEDITKR